MSMIVEEFETITLSNKGRINYVNQDFAKFNGKLHNFICKANEEHHNLVKSEYIPNGFTMAFAIDNSNVLVTGEVLSVSPDKPLNKVLEELGTKVKVLSGNIDIIVTYSRDYIIFPVKPRIVKDK